MCKYTYKRANTRMSLLKNLVPPNYEFGIGQCTFYPGPLKCFGAPRHQIFAKSPPQKVRNRNKAEFATKVRKSS